MSELERRLLDEPRGVEAQMARIRESLDGMAAVLREVNRDLAAFAARKARSHIDGPVV